MDAGVDEAWLPEQNSDSLRQERGKGTLMDQPTMYIMGWLSQSRYLIVWLLFIHPAFISVAG